tara:strand:+ start:324 stop:590 length:267 start_codon:yes stop_codon:yes gene_type:complete
MRLNNNLMGMAGATSRRNPVNTTGTGVTPMDLMQNAIASRNESRLENAIIQEDSTQIARETLERITDKRARETMIMFAVLGLAYWGLK